MLKRMYEKSELYFALAWIGAYVLVMNLALQVCGGFDHLEQKTMGQVLVPVLCIGVLAVFSTVWILRCGLGEKFGLCPVRGNVKTYLWWIPLILMSCVNLKNGLSWNAPAGVAMLMAVHLAAAGYVEEIIFRGFLFRAMEKDNLKFAVIVSAVTFGAGHIVNLMNTADVLGVLLQVCYAVVIGFLFTVIAYKSGSLWPCVVSHMFVNGSSVFAREEGAFSRMAASLFGSQVPGLDQVCSAVLIIAVSGGYALWLWKKAE